MNYSCITIITQFDLRICKDPNPMQQTVKENRNQAATSEPISGSAVYHTLEDPEQPSDDNFYHYPDTTNITRPPATSPELEYSYAKETDIPKPVRKSEDGNNAFYHTLQDGQPPSNDLHKEPCTSIPTDLELEYTYAKDTETPRIPVVTKDAVYHSLEQEEPVTGEQDPASTQPQTNSTNNNFYHTLEEPNSTQTETENVRNSQVNKILIVTEDLYTITTRAIFPTSLQVLLKMLE